MVDWVYKCVFVTKIGVINCVTCSTTYGLSPGLYIVLMYKQTKKTTLPGRGYVFSRYDCSQTGVYRVLMDSINFSIICLLDWINQPDAR